MVPNFVSETIVQNVGESNAAFMARVNLFIATQRSYYEQAGGSYPPASPASTAYLGYPPSEANFTVFWDVTNTQHRQIASFFYDYTYYLYLMALPSPIYPPSFAYPVIYQGMWDANTNTPTLVSGTGTQGHYYQVSVSGTTTLDGISSWGVDDWVVFNGTTWTRVANAQATEILKGVAEIATQPETDAGIDDTRIVTPLKLGGWWTAVKAAAQTISGVWTFITSLRIRSTANPNYAEITGNFTANRTVTIPDKDITIASSTGDTFTGLIDFSGTGHAGLRLNNLTTAQRQALSPTAGMKVFDTDLGVECLYNGTFWVYAVQKYVTSNTTTTSNVASAITDLTFELEATAIYIVSGYLLISCNNTGGVKFGATLPAGASCDIGFDGASTGLTAAIQQRSSNGALTATAHNRFNGTSSIYVGGRINAGVTGGTMTFYFASGTNTQTSTIFTPASNIILTRVA